MQEHRCPVPRACRMVRLSRAAYYRPPVPASRRDAAVDRRADGRGRALSALGLLEAASIACARKDGRGITSACIACTARCALNLPRRTTRRVPQRDPATAGGAAACSIRPGRSIS